MGVKTTYGAALKKMLVIDSGAHGRPLDGILRSGTGRLLLTGINYDFSSVATAVKLAERHCYNLIVFKIDNSDDAVADLVKKVRQVRPATPILFLSMQEKNRNIVKILRSGADGYVQKEAIATELQNAIAYLLRGQKYIS